jgi:crotonobetainyl-CoA:carnitine CoA-transferase CaiB-like acyl-CoA transferase
MESVLQGVRVIELAEWGLVPCCGAVLADLGADVIKVEHPSRGDVMRASRAQPSSRAPDAYDYAFEQFNRGKRSLGLDLSEPAGHQLFLELVRRCDVLITGFLAPARERLDVTYERLSPLNPRLIYACAHGQGQRGPDAEGAGFSSVSYWARGGIGNALTPPGGPYIQQPNGFADPTTAMSLACGITAALYRRSVTGRGGTIDVSMLGTAVWQMGLEILASQEPDAKASDSRETIPANPLAATAYRTADGRFLVLGMRQSDRYWPAFCSALGRADLIEDARFAGAEQRAKNRAALYGLVRDAFAAATPAEWAARLDRHACVWSLAQSPAELLLDAQVVANGYLPDHPARPGRKLAANPIQFDGRLPSLARGAPRLGEHTAEILRDLGLAREDGEPLRRKSVVANDSGAPD